MQVITPEQAAQLIKDDWTLTTSGFGHCGAPEALIGALEQRHRQTATPSRLSLLFASGPGDRGEQGLDRLAHSGLLRRIIGGFWSLAPRIGRMVVNEEIEAHNWPQGVVSHMFRAIASDRPGVITDVGLGTFVDPVHEGGCLNKRTSIPLIERIKVLGRTTLLYRAMPLNCALLRGTRADEHGNITMEREANIQDVLAQAQAVRNCGGIVIVQVLEIAKAGSLPLLSIKIPGFLVDYVVLANPDEHWQTYGEQYNPSYSGEWIAGVQSALPAESISAKRIVARRALLELRNFSNQSYRHRPLVVNLGIGTPEMIASESRREHLSGGKDFTLTVESGAVGGHPAGGMSFGATAYPDALLTQAEQFDHYDGGGIDIAFLGFGQIDKCGRVNVASFGNRLNGVGGFINISQSAKRLVFCGTFTADGLTVEIDEGTGLNISKEGLSGKLVEVVDRVCYDPRGRTRCRNPLVITERAVFQLSDEGLELVEVAPGVDIERDIISRSEINIRISKTLKTMPATSFKSGPLTVPFAS